MFSPVNTAVSYAVPTPSGANASASNSGSSVGMFAAPPAHTGSALSLVHAQSASSLQLHSVTPMTPATPAPEGSGIVPQLQYISFFFVLQPLFKTFPTAQY